MSLGEGAAEDREVLREDEDASPFDESVSRDHAITGKFLLVEAEVLGTVLDELIELLESPFIQKELYALARSPFTRLVLA
jgi:hypothetical protein